MGMGDLQADCSAETNHRWIKNAWLQHFDLLSGRPIQIIWAWVTFQRIIVLEPNTNGMVVQLALNNWNPYTNCMVD
jgi:hypothetical protein